MRKYKYLVLKNKTSLTKYFVRHCVILDEATSLCYHLDEEGYKIEHISNLMERYDLVEEYAFQSEEDVETFMICYAKRVGEYDWMSNNCEMFANSFYHGELMNQNDFYACAVIFSSALLYSIL